MLRYVWMFLIWCVCLILTGTVFEMFAWGAVKPDLVMLWAIYVALHHTPARGAACGFVSGLLFDFYLGRYFGVYAVVLPLISLLSGILQKKWYRENIPLTIVLVFLLTCIGQSAVAALNLAGGAALYLRDVLPLIAGIAFYNALLTPLTYPWLHKAFTLGFLRRKLKWEEER
ncbi:MAG: rod shape-determining protein MreD [Gracilibacteraceae bacterium]|nr:rod shape-determining protein MreD [Gracilibacteraceae bacterium]